MTMASNRKYVLETKAAKALSCYIIMRCNKHIATVRAHFADGGTCVVNVHHTRAARKFAEFQHATASGWGYNKFTAALRGLVIDGHTMVDDCEVKLKYPKGRASFPRDYKAPKGYRLANYAEGSERWKDSGEKKWHGM